MVIINKEVISLLKFCQDKYPNRGFDRFIVKNGNIVSTNGRVLFSYKIDKLKNGDYLLKEGFVSQPKISHPDMDIDELSEVENCNKYMVETLNGFFGLMAVKEIPINYDKFLGVIKKFFSLAGNSIVVFVNKSIDKPIVLKTNEGNATLIVMPLRKETKYDDN